MQLCDSAHLRLERFRIGTKDTEPAVVQLTRGQAVGVLKILKARLKLRCHDRLQTVEYKQRFGWTIAIATTVDLAHVGMQIALAVVVTNNLARIDLRLVCGGRIGRQRGSGWRSCFSYGSCGRFLWQLAWWKCLSGCADHFRQRAGGAFWI